MKWLEQLAMRFLRARGWIVFWLDDAKKQACGPTAGVCWLQLYLDERAALSTGEGDLI